ncbi:MAG: dehydratase [Desulfatitalea sp. BRH_c12]|nr:MAG: dehydratase [Desulfatitalea sp. BRH_c12]
MEHSILITGGAGFIGSHLADDLVRLGHSVRILDNLCEQVHGPDGAIPTYLNPRAEIIQGDICDRKTVAAALKGAGAVVHLAAAVGVGQSMYQIEKYMQTNSLGTAVLLEEVIKNPVKKLVVASSMSIYGEGCYRTADNVRLTAGQRTHQQLGDGVWDILDVNGAPLIPMPTPESKALTLSSVYALSKYDQEMLCLMAGRTYGIPTVALRFFNVYGPRQALSNPYTGVLAIFAARLLNNKPPLIFEDGRQQRDFVSVHDVARACRMALASDLKEEVLNIGSGQAYTIIEIAELLAQVMGKPHIAPVITGKYRVGDIRHCYADISRARRLLGYHPEISMTDGLAELCKWLADQQAEDHVDRAHLELAERGLTV